MPLPGTKQSNPSSSSPTMAFGSSVDTLIEIYSNCISLLKAFKRRGSNTSGEDGHDRKRQAQLRKSLRSDRARVRGAYSSALSEAGSRFERGDDRARSALSRVLRKLKAAIANILRSAAAGTPNDQPGLDYESLTLLSNASRSETIRTFDRLSRRLGSPSSSSSSRLAVAPSSSSPGRHKRRRSGHSASGSTASTKSGGGGGRDSNRRKDGPPRKKAASPSPRTPERDGNGRGGGRGAAPKQPKPAAAASTQPKLPPAKQHAPSPRRRSPPPRAPAVAVPNRTSLASIATDSTKLGEIPARKWTSASRPRDSHSSGDSREYYYNVKPVFPLRRYESPPASNRERGFWGLFRRRS